MTAPAVRFTAPPADRLAAARAQIEQGDHWLDVADLLRETGGLHGLLDDVVLTVLAASVVAADNEED